MLINRDLNIALVQFDIEWLDVDANLQKLDKLLSNVKADMIVLPEMFATGFYAEPQNVPATQIAKVYEWMAQFSLQKEVVVAGSTIWKEKEFDYRNRVSFYRSGKLIGSYDKRHLFSLGNEHVSYQQGSVREIIPVDGWNICPLICYDLRFPVWSRNSENYHLLLYVANWPAARQDVWETLLRARAIENQSYVVGVNRIGVDGNNISYQGGSKVINPAGKIVFNLEDKQEVGIVSLNLTDLEDWREKYKFLQDRDEFTIS